MIMSARLLSLFILECLSILCLFHFTSAEVCYDTKVTQNKYYTGCGLFWWWSCTKYRTMYYKTTKCCAGWTGPSCDYPLCGNLNITNGGVVISSILDGVKATYSCHPQYYLMGVSERTCTADELWDGEQPSCVFTQSCNDDPCQNNGVCKTDGTCTCPEGWTGTRCELVSIPCSTEPCQNSGVCNNDDTCTCPDGWSGNRCELVTFSCITTPCQNNGTCNGNDTCSCLQGWIGATCEIMDESTNESPKQSPGGSGQNMGLIVAVPIVCILVTLGVLIALVVVVVYCVKRKTTAEQANN